MPDDLSALRASLARAGRNYVALGEGDGDPRPTTSGPLGRFRARRPDAAAQEANRAAVDALVARLRGVAGYGDALADAVRGRLAGLRQSGKPLSGRVAAGAIAEALPGAQEAHVRREHARINVRDTVSRVTPDGLLGTLGRGMAASLGVSGDELAAWLPAVQESVRTQLEALAERAGQSPAEADVRRAIGVALLKAVAEARGPALVEAARQALGIASPLDIDRVRWWLGAPSELGATADRALSGAVPLDAALRDWCQSVARRLHRSAVVRELERSIPAPVPDGSPFGQAVNLRVRERGAGADAPAHRMADMALRLRELAERAILSRQPPGGLPSPAELDALRDGLLDEYFGQLDAYAARPDLPADARAAARAVQLETLGVVKPAHHGAAAGLQRAGSALVAALARAGTPGETRELLEGFGRDFNAALGALPGDTGQDEIGSIVELALGAALRRPDAPAILGRLATPGSAFLQALGTLEGATYLESPLWAKMLTMALRDRMEALTSPQNPWLAHFGLPVDPFLLPAGQRPGARRAGTADLVPPLATPEVRRSWNAALLPQVAEMGRFDDRARQPYPTGFADPNDPRWTVSEQCALDIHRHPFVLDGLETGSPEAFTARMPDRRAAAQVSRVLHQGLAALLGTAAPPALQGPIMGALATPHLLDIGRAEPYQSGTAVSLGGGAFRITYEFGKHARQTAGLDPSPDGRALTDMRGSVSFTIQTGPEPQIRDLEADAMVLALGSTAP